MARLSGILILSTHQLKQTHQNWIPSDKTFWIRAWPEQLLLVSDIENSSMLC